MHMPLLYDSPPPKHNSFGSKVLVYGCRSGAVITAVPGFIWPEASRESGIGFILTAVAVTCGECVLR